MIFSESLKKNKDFKTVYETGKCVVNRYLVMYILPNGTDKNRIGISVSKKVGNSVVRHRIKRLIKESYRIQEARFSNGLDIVVIVRRSARTRTYADMERALVHLGKLHNIIDNDMEKFDDETDFDRTH